MHILISKNGELSLEDIDNMKAFSIIDKSEHSNLYSLLSIAEPAEDKHYWIDANAVVSLSPKSNDQAWIESFWSMLAAVEKYGYSDLKNKRVKAHME